MAVSTCVTLQKRDFCITYECDQEVEHCQYAMCEEMPPQAGARCGFNKDLQCQCIEVRIKAVEAMIRRLRNKKKELEEELFFNEG